MEKEQGQLLHVRVSIMTYEKLRLTSYQTKRSIASLVREVVEKHYGEGEEENVVREKSG
jgi:predicted DNA-binding protein